MQLAAITDEISQDFEYALDVLCEYGIEGAELRGLWGTNIADLTPEQIVAAKKALRDRAMKVVALSTPFYKCDLEPAAENPGESAGAMHLAKPRGLEEQIAMLRRCIDMAHTFETPYLRVFSFWRKEALTPEIEARIAAAFEEPLHIAETYGMTLLLENEFSCYLGTGEETARFVSTVNAPNLKICWDPGNAFCAGELPYPTGYEFAKPWIAHVHIKDAVMQETPDHGKQPQWCVVGEGEIDYAGQFDALKRDGYTGAVSLETHFRPTTGSAPDGRGTPEEGSRPCLVALKRFISH